MNINNELIIAGLFKSLQDYALWEMIIIKLIKIILIIVGAKISIKLIDKSINNLILRREKLLKLSERRGKTVAYLIHNVTMYTIFFVAILLILGELNIDLRPILAGAGVFGLAIGFGAQNLVRDMITGFFIIFEDQFAVGDYIAVNNKMGTVEEIGLRTTKIKSFTGEINIIPNGSITEVTNYSINNSIAIVDVGIAYEENIDRAINAIKEIIKEKYQGNENILKEPEVLGVNALGNYDVKIRIIAETKPMAHFAVERYLRNIIKTGLEERNIEIPYQKIVLFNQNRD